MKKFEFPLDSALRWRKTIADLRKAEAMNSARAVAAAEATVQRLEAARIEAGRQLATQSDGAGLAAFSGYLERSRREILKAQSIVVRARAALEAARKRLIEADRDARLIEKLKERRLAEWRAEADREIEQFAAESFLNRR